MTMQAGKKPHIEPRKRTGTKILKGLLLLLILWIGLTVFLVPAVVSSEKSRRLILAKTNDAIAGHTNFTDLSIGWLKGVRIADFSFNDEAGRISVRAGQIETTPHYA